MNEEPIKEPSSVAGSGDLTTEEGGDDSDNLPVTSTRDLGPEPPRSLGYQPPQITSPKWRQIVENKGTTKFDDKQKSRFLKHFARHGRIGHAAAAADVTSSLVNNHRKADPVFDEACRMAQEAWKERCELTAERVAIRGVRRPIMGGQYKDKIVAYEIIYDSKILLAELKRVNPEYREKNETTLNINAGVLAIPVLPQHATAEEALAQWDAQQRTEREQRDALAEQQQNATQKQLGSPDGDNEG